MAGQALHSITGFRLVTANLPRLTRFYVDVLGFAADGPPMPIGVDELTMLELSGGGQRQVLRLGAQTIALEAFERLGAPYPAQGNAASLWFQHLALVVDDIDVAHTRLRGGSAITDGGPQHLPPSSGGVSAFKFRDQDGHPLELLQFPAGGAPPAWRGKRPLAGQIGLGIDHSAISVSDVDVSTAFYAGFGLAPGKRSHNEGAEQQGLDGLKGVQVAVAPLQPSRTPPHLELLGYQIPRGAAGPQLRANDVAATRVAWRGDWPALLRDPDGHLHQIET